MSEKEWLDDLIYERMELLLDNRRADNDQKEKKLLDRVDDILQRLTREDWKIIDQFLDHITDRGAEEMAYLYACGFQDGIRTMKWMNSL